MAILVGSFLTGFGLLLLALIFQIRRERARNQDFLSLELEPNCLLTRHPLVFLSGRRSIFKIFDHWNRIPRFLREHGYEVLVLEPPAGLGINVDSSLIRALDDLPEPGHLISDTSLENTLETISRVKHEKIASLTLVRNPTAARPTSSRQRVRAESLRPPAHAVETFELRIPQQSAAPSLFGIAALLLLGLHNLLIQARGQTPIDPLETGEFQASSHWTVERAFLRLAVALAERDLQNDRMTERERNTHASLGA